MTQGAEEHQWTQCRQRSCRDARLARITPGRKARFAGMKNRSKIRRIALRNISGRKAPKSIGGRNAGKDRAGTQGWRRSRQEATKPAFR
ncbi:hypothetical protein V511_09575 [Mesotoga sp. Brook.08.YT.4.2.5.1]|nr:hypothetical protein V511_09575 [Mesotoga sp. Brook.08.YT.4.2.5.1]RAO96624.1 hypothetical protein M388_13560 [Mesotoga sp. Brook.08.YT.4.2.5.4.]RDI93332.1 hypothetical protein Q502_06320 [Mesotoga sp. Brook.08.YT.4.2.5.2.]